MFIIWIVLGVLSCAYGVFILGANSGTRFYTVWFMIGAVCFLLSAAARNHWIRKLPKVVKGIGLTVILVGACLFVFVESLIISRFDDRGEPDLDYLIVLGAQMRETGPSRVLKYRLDAACQYLTEHEGTLCIVTGGKGDNEIVTEAEGMRDYLTGRGIAESRILLEEQATDTSENIRFSSLLLDKEKDRVGIVTNDFHLFRGVSIAKKQGFRHVCGIAAGSTRAYLPNNMLREFLGVLKDFVCGNIG